MKQNPSRGHSLRIPRDWKPLNVVSQDSVNELGLSPWFIKLLNAIARWMP